MASSFTSESLTMSDCLTHFIQQNNAQVATRSPYASSSHCPDYDLSSLLTNSAYHFHKDFPCVKDDCLIVSIVGTTGAFLRIYYENEWDFNRKVRTVGNRLRRNPRIRPPCRCRSPNYASVGCQRSGRRHDSIVARGGPRCARFGATLPVEVTLAFKLGLKWPFGRTI